MIADQIIGQIVQTISNKNPLLTVELLAKQKVTQALQKVKQLTRYDIDTLTTAVYKEALLKQYLREGPKPKPRQQYFNFTMSPQLVHGIKRYNQHRIANELTQQHQARLSSAEYEIRGEQKLDRQAVEIDQQLQRKERVKTQNKRRLAQINAEFQMTQAKHSRQQAQRQLNASIEIDKQVTSRQIREQDQRFYKEMRDQFLKKTEYRSQLQDQLRSIESSRQSIVSVEQNTQDFLSLLYRPKQKAQFQQASTVQYQFENQIKLDQQRERHSLERIQRQYHETLIRQDWLERGKQIQNRQQNFALQQHLKQQIKQRHTIFQD